MIIKTTSHLINSLIAILLGSLFIVYAVPALSETTEVARTSKSISFTSSTEMDKASKDELLIQADADVNAPLIKQGYRAESSVAAARIVGASYISEGVMWIYDATTDLISDFDGDDFYHRFSVTIDADTQYERSNVYARLYLSYEGGPWNHYATSGVYAIYGDSELDAFVIETELGDGFPPGYYDVRIVLYDADIDASVVNYGPYDDTSLSTLPLEDSFYDDIYSGSYYPVETEVVIAGSASGSMSLWLLMVPALLTVIRRMVK